MFSCEPTSQNDSTILQADTISTLIQEPGGVKSSQYLPAYSSAAISGGKKTIPLTITVSFRNTDPNSSITVTRVAYYDSDGALVKDYLEQSQVVQKLSSVEFIVPERDLTGGTSASFVIDYFLDSKEMNGPVINGVHINSNSGISFITEGIQLKN
jgi:hypothetical protein